MRLANGGSTKTASRLAIAMLLAAVATPPAWSATASQTTRPRTMLDRAIKKRALCLEKCAATYGAGSTDYVLCEYKCKGVRF